jgi:hypothetical protein
MNNKRLFVEILKEALEEVKGTKVERGEDWLESVFIPKVLPEYAEGSFTQEFGGQLNPGEYIIDHDTDGAGDVICFITVAFTKDKYEELKSELETSYDSFIKPFKKQTDKKLYYPEILSNDDDMTLTFEITIYK